MSTLIYVAEPIDQIGQPFSRKVNGPEDWVLYRPAEAFECNSSDLCIERVNRQVLAGADGVLAFLPRGVPTVGVPAEIEWALGHGVPVVIVTDNTDSVAIKGFVDRGAESYFYTEKAVEALDFMMLEQPDPGELGFVKTRPEAQIPTKGYSDDAGMDLYVAERVTIPSNQFRDVPCGVVANLHPGTWGLVVGRSSTLRKRKLWVYQGVIDASFRGELFVGVWNFGGSGVDVEVGDRLGQLIVMPTSPLTPAPADKIVPGLSRRGQAGFGSTGA